MAKKQEVRSMFDSIAWRYDFLNHFLSFGIDFLWRRKAINEIRKRIDPVKILDIATGTCDLAIAAVRLNPESIFGIDISQRMLEEGRRKIHKKHLENMITLSLADSEKLPFEEKQFDVAMVAFGVRNFESPEKGLSEMFRVLRVDGIVMILEFSRPDNLPFRSVYHFYFKRILPLFGKLFSKDGSAYGYLPDSVSTFPESDQFLALMNKAGFSNLFQRRLTGGIATIYIGQRN